MNPSRIALLVAIVGLAAVAGFVAMSGVDTGPDPGDGPKVDLTAAVPAPAPAGNGADVAPRKPMRPVGIPQVPDAPPRPVAPEGRVPSGEVDEGAVDEAVRSTAVRTMGVHLDTLYAKYDDALQGIADPSARKYAREALTGYETQMNEVLAQLEAGELEPDEGFAKISEMRNQAAQAVVGKLSDDDAQSFRDKLNGGFMADDGMDQLGWGVPLDEAGLEALFEGME